MIGRIVTAKHNAYPGLRMHRATEIAASKRGREAFGPDLRRSGGFEANGEGSAEVYQWLPRRDIADAGDCV